MAEALAPGQMLSHYRIERRLGAGGMGEVYLAHDNALERTVALKVLPAELAQDAERLRRFTQEAKAASAINHPNVATIYEIGEAAGLRFIAMEYVAGQTLAARSWNCAEIIGVAVQVADALDAAHTQGVVHRDLKPANIMLAGHDRVKVLDFGLAKMVRPPEAEGATETNTLPGLLMGTVHYMSPEQALGREVDHRTDIFSFGVVLYEMLTGRLPFSGGTVTETIHRITTAPIEAIGRFNYEAPADIDRIVRKCLEKDRERRYQSARDLLVDLRNLQRDSQPGIAPAPAPRARKRWPWAAAAALALAVAVAAGFFLLREKPPESLAVLPFAGDPAVDYLNDGITASLIQGLSQLPRLRVMSLAAVARYKGKPPDPLAVRRDLGAEKVLTGRLAQRGDDLAITIELVDSRDNSHVWGQQYNRKLAGILTLQEEISRDVTDQLRLRLSGADRKRLTKRYTDNAEAYQLYLKGRYYSDLFTKDGALKGLDYYRQALAKDPRYALAYAGIADSWIIFADWYLSPSESIPKAKEAAEQALRIDDALAEAHTSLGIIACSYDWNWTASEAEFRRALELNPRYARAISFYGWHLLVTGKTEEGIREMKRAFETEPQPEAGGFLSLGLQFVRQHDQAIEYARKTLAIDPNFYIAHVSLGLALEQKRQFQDAAAAFESAARLFDSPWILAQIARVRAVAGNRAEARQRLEHLLKLKTERYVAPLDIASVYLGLGQNDQAMAWLEKAFIDRNGFLIYLRTDPLLDGLRSDPRFQDLVRRMRFP